MNISETKKNKTEKPPVALTATSGLSPSLPPSSPSLSLSPLSLSPSLSLDPFPPFELFRVCCNSFKTNNHVTALSVLLLWLFSRLFTTLPPSPSLSLSHTHKTKGRKMKRNIPMFDSSFPFSLPIPLLPFPAFQVSLISHIIWLLMRLKDSHSIVTKIQTFVVTPPSPPLLPLLPLLPLPLLRNSEKKNCFSFFKK